VLQVIARLNLGGPAHQVSLLSGRRLDPSRYETLLIHGHLAAGEESMADLAAKEGARMRYLPSLRQEVFPPRDLRALGSLIRVIRQFRPQIVHTHTAKAGFLGRQAALLAGPPRPRLVHTYHGHVLEGYFGALKSTAYRGLERRMARLTDSLVAVSQATVDDLVRLGIAPRDRFRVIPMGIDLSPFVRLDGDADQGLRRELGISADEVLFTYVGRVVPIKRLDLLLRGFARARTNEARVRLVVVGDGETRPQLERLTRELGIAETVSFLGYRRDLVPIAAAGDVAILSSDNEGTPVSLIEAGAAATPAVATAVGGVAEVVTPDSGLLVPAGDEAALAASILRLAEDSELRHRMGQRAREYVLNRFSAERLISDMDALYQELLSR
jgi:glycosyltransferase involved in cell wall biosynthesis